MYAPDHRGINALQLANESDNDIAEIMRHIQEGNY
jgi:hypothetical protein